jgi:beta-lactamase superfamily II metal-dependent hydrolase
MQYKLPNSFYAAVCVVLIAANMGVYRAIFAPQMLTVTVLEVWNGNATLLQSPRGETLLIDTGPDASILRALGENLPMWQRDIDAVILTSSGGPPHCTISLPHLKNHPHRRYLNSLRHFFCI